MLLKITLKRPWSYKNKHKLFKKKMTGNSVSFVQTTFLVLCCFCFYLKVDVETQNYNDTLLFLYFTQLIQQLTLVISLSLQFSVVEIG
jgi:hypothetical protein